jgi:Polysaccharide lyase
MPKTKPLLAALCLLGAVTTRGEAAVLFENTGTLMGWSRVYVQQQGTNTMVSAPTFEGASAIKSTQTFVVADGRGYHSERVMFDIQRNGQDYYYGLALYLPPDWVFHDQNVTFQQWAFENPGGGGPWILMFVQNDKLRMGGSGASGSRDLATITNLRGTWIRIVTRINMTTSGPFEVWVNGTKTASAPINLVVGGDPPTIRWSTGIYCTAWRTQQPAGGSPISVWHDHLRVATTYNEAEPASWGNPSLVDAGAADGPTMEDAAISDVRAGDSGSAGADGTGAGGSAGGAGGAGGASGASGVAGAGGSGMSGMSGTRGTAGATAGRGGTGAGGQPPQPAQNQSGCGCAVGRRGPAPPGALLLGLPFAATVFARRRARRAKLGQMPWQHRLPR